MTESVIEKKFLEAINLLPKGISKIVIGLSGGADSVTLAHLLVRFKDRLGCKLEAIYVHHGLSSHADEWADFCHNYSQKLDIDFYCERVVLDLGPRVSLESEARNKRYQVLKQHFGHEFCALATAHHANDEAETFFLALKRGAGLPGLAAMGELQSFSTGVIWRPLLRVSRADIEEYTRIHNLEYVTDESNSDENYDRNYLRHQIIPLLCSRYPSFLNMVGLSAKYIAEAQSIIEDVGESDFYSCDPKLNSISITQLQKLSLVRQKNVIRLFFHKYVGKYPSRELSELVFRDIIPASIDATPFSCYEGYSIRRYQDRIYVVNDKTLDHPNFLTIKLNAPFVILGRTWVLTKTEGRGYKELPTILDFTLPFSTNLHPYNRSFGRNLKKLFGEYKIPVWERKVTPIVKGENEQILGLYPNYFEKNIYAETQGYIFECIDE